MKIPLLLPIMLAASLSLSCNDTSTNPVGQNNAPVFLESEFLNYAWGYAHSGWIADSAGNLVSYNLAKSGVQWVPNQSGYYTAEELRAKVHHNDTLRRTVELDTLQWLGSLAVASVGGEYSDTTHPMVDAGTITLCCYVYEADSAKYRRVVLQVNGDYQFYNTATPAVQLSNWMSRQTTWY